MIGVRDYFTSLTKKDLEFFIELVNNAKCKVVGLGIFMFQREFGK